MASNFISEVGIYKHIVELCTQQGIWFCHIIIITCGLEVRF